RYSDQNPQLYRIQTRASLIDSRANEYPEINFVFDSEGKPQDTEFAIVDTRVAPRGKLVIWLMGPKPELFDRLASYGMHA
ncbi:unnamed protein product, partial [Chrysoparadoxa australica]